MNVVFRILFFNHSFPPVDLIFSEKCIAVHPRLLSAPWLLRMHSSQAFFPGTTPEVTYLPSWLSTAFVSSGVHGLFSLLWEGGAFSAALFPFELTRGHLLLFGIRSVALSSSELRARQWLAIVSSFPLSSSSEEGSSDPSVISGISAKWIININTLYFFMAISI